MTDSLNLANTNTVALRFSCHVPQGEYQINSLDFPQDPTLKVIHGSHFLNNTLSLLFDWLAVFNCNCSFIIVLKCELVNV